MSGRHDRTISAARKAGGNAARRHARGEHVQAPDPLAGSLLARKAATAWHAGFAEATSHTDMPEVKAVSGPDLSPRSGMISLDLPAGSVDPVPGGMDDGTHHVTIVYLGPDVDDDAYEAACQRAAAATAAVPGPLQATLAGIGTFPPSDGSDGKTPVFIPASIPGGDHLRNGLADLSASEHREWHPHVTLAYAGAGDALPPEQPRRQVTFTHLAVHRGDDVRRFPLGPATITKGANGMHGTLEHKVGPRGYTHGWRFVGVPGVGHEVHHPSHGKGIVTEVTGKHVTVKFHGSGATRTYEHAEPKSGGKTGFVKRSEHEAAASLHAGHAAEAHRLAASIRGTSADIPVRGHPSASAALESASAHFGRGDATAARRDIGETGSAMQFHARQLRTQAEGHDKMAASTRGTAFASDWKGRAAAAREPLDRLDATVEGARQLMRATKPDTAAAGIPIEPGYRLGFTRDEAAREAARAKAELGKPQAAEVPHGATRAERTAQAGRDGYRTQGDAIAHAKRVRAAEKEQFGETPHPPLATFGTTNSVNSGVLITSQAVDHEGREYRIGLDKNAGTVTVNHNGKSLTEPAGTNPTQKARELAGKLTAPAAADAKPEADSFWAAEPAPAPPPPPAPKPKYEQGGMFAEPDKLGTAPMFGDQFGTSGITEPNAAAAGSDSGPKLTIEEARNAYRAATGREPSDRILKNWAAVGTDSEGGTPWHDAAVAAKNAGRPMTAVPDFMQAEQLERDSYHIRDPALEDRMNGAAVHLRAGNHDQARELLASARPSDDFAANLVNEHLGKLGKPVAPDPNVARREAHIAAAAASEAARKTAPAVSTAVPGAWAPLVAHERGALAGPDEKAAAAIDAAAGKLHQERKLSHGEHAHVLAARDAFTRGDYATATDHLTQALGSLNSRERRGDVYHDRKTSSWVGNLLGHAESKRTNRRIVAYSTVHGQPVRTVSQPNAALASGQADQRPVASTEGRLLTSNDDEVNAHLDNAARALAGGDKTAAAGHLAAASFAGGQSRPGSNEGSISDRARRQSDQLASRDELPRTPGASHVVAEGSHMGVHWTAHEQRDELGNGLDRTYTLSHDGHTRVVPAHFGPHAAISDFLENRRALPAAAPAGTAAHAAEARSIADNVRLERGLSKGQRDEAEGRLYAAARHLDDGNHAEAAAELDAAAHMAGLPGGGAIKDSTAARARQLLGKIRAAAPGREAKSLAAEGITALAGALASRTGREDAVRHHLGDAVKSLQAGDPQAAYGALDMARRHAAGELGGRPSAAHLMVLLDDGTEAHRPILRWRDTVRREP